jgi:hypothetical protein
MEAQDVADIHIGTLFRNGRGCPYIQSDTHRLAGDLPRGMPGRCPWLRGADCAAGNFAAAAKTEFLVACQLEPALFPPQ